jgi:hypothetical protein
MPADGSFHFFIHGHLFPEPQPDGVPRQVMEFQPPPRREQESAEGLKQKSTFDLT